MTVNDNNKSVFVSYRRSVSKWIARSIAQNLIERGYEVFLDSDSIDSGTFETVILNQIASRPHFLVVLAPGSLERCMNSDDWLRREVEFAISLGRNVVPIAVDGFNLKDDEKYLSGRLTELTKYNQLPLHSDYFVEGMDRLCTRFLKHAENVVLGEIPPQDQEVAKQLLDEINQNLEEIEAALLSEFSELETTRNELQAKLDLLIEERAEIRRTNEVYYVQMKELEEQLNRLRAVDGSSCPVCKQPLSELDRASLLTEMQSSGRGIGDLYRKNQEHLDHIETDIQILRNRITHLNSQLKYSP